MFADLAVDDGTVLLRQGSVIPVSYRYQGPVISLLNVVWLDECLHDHVSISLELRVAILYVFQPLMRESD